MERELQRRMIQAEATYFSNRQYLEEKYELLADRKRVFLKNLEQLSEGVRLTTNRLKISEGFTPFSVYYLLEQASEEGQHLLKKAGAILEDRLEENQQQYRKQCVLFEEEKRRLNRNEET